MFTVSLPALLRRLLRPTPRARRVDVCPPARLAAAGAAPGWRASLRDWLDTGSSRPRHRGSERQSVAPSPIEAVRAEFLESVSDIRTQQVGMLQQRIGIARSMHELWHLRPEVFKLVALRFSQFEAQTRLDRLNRHFPTRAPRSGFGNFDPGASQRRPARQR